MAEQRSFVAGRFNTTSADIFIEGQLTSGAPRPIPVVVLRIDQHHPKGPSFGYFSMSPSEALVLAQALIATVDELNVTRKND